MTTRRPSPAWPSTWTRLELRFGTQGNQLYYLATPASTFPTLLHRLSEADLLPREEQPGQRPWRRLVIEKPFGRDLETARELNRSLSSVLDERQIFRIDHYLGKETVQNILVFRFANLIFEPLWNRNYVDHVEITATEMLGMEGGRGRFYDETGVIRDMVQNHLLQVLALCAMEPPSSFAAEDIRDEKNKVFRSLRSVEGSDVATHVVAGQYRGYREEPGVAKDSRTPTYVAMKMNVDNWRWKGVPFYLRAGKKLAKRLTEVSIHFKSVPISLFSTSEACQRLQPNVLRLRIQPQEGIALSFESKVPGEDVSIAGVTMDFTYKEAFAKPVPEAYERLLLDCMRGNATLFARKDSVEQAWAYVTPILRALESGVGGAHPAVRARERGPGRGGGAAGEGWAALDGAQVSRPSTLVVETEALAPRAAEWLAEALATGARKVVAEPASRSPVGRRRAPSTGPWRPCPCRGSGWTSTSPTSGAFRRTTRRATTCSWRRRSCGR